MITRIVRLSFKEEHIQTFLVAFENSKTQIAAFPGCTQLKLFKDFSEAGVFYTHSVWESMEDLENYRKSELFKSTWAIVKPMFHASPQVFSLTDI